MDMRLLTEILAELQTLKVSEGEYFTRDKLDECIRKNKEFEEVKAEALVLELDAVDINITTKQYVPAKLKNLQQALANNKEKFDYIKQSIIDYFLRSKRLAVNVLKKIEEVNNNIAIAHAQSKLITPNASELLQACTVVANKRLAEAKQLLNKVY